SWGTDGDLSTWSGPAVADMAFAARAAELSLIRAGERAGALAARELLALQASDWPFMVSRGVAVPYARERCAGHRERCEDVLVGGDRAVLAHHRLGADGDLSLVRADLAAVADPRPAPHAQHRVAPDLELDAWADEAQAVCLQAPAVAQAQAQVARDQAQIG